MKTRQMKRLEQVLGPTAREIAKVLMTPAGKVLMKALEDQFLYGDLQGDDDREMHFAHGARDVVLYLRGMTRTAEQLGDTNGRPEGSST